MERGAPFLVNYGPYVGCFLVGCVTVTYFTKIFQSAPGYGKSAQGESKRNSVNTNSGGRKRVTFTLWDGGDDDDDNTTRKRVNGELCADEVGLVFRDQTQQATDALRAEEDDLAMMDETDDKEKSHVPYTPVTYPEPTMVERSRVFYQLMNRRRTVRRYSDRKIPGEVLDNIIRTAGTSPSGAHTEPWTFAAVHNTELKSRIREIIEEEEAVNYRVRMVRQWVEDLKPLKTTWVKDYLTEAPCLIVVFKQTYGWNPDGTRKNHYYNEISTSISIGILLAAIQNAGLVSLTSTPLNAGPKIRLLLGRPDNEKVLILLPVGYAVDDVTVPDFSRKSQDQIQVTYD